MDVRELLPKDKFDDKVIDDLQKLSFEEIKPIIPNLLEWLQDMNWPIAGLIADILLPFSDRITPEIINVLKTDDGIWKMWVLLTLVKNIKDPLLLVEVEKIAKFPSMEEIENEVDLIAVAILNSSSATGNI